MIDDIRPCLDCRGLKGKRCVNSEGFWYPGEIPKEILTRGMRCLGFVDRETGIKGEELWPYLRIKSTS